MRTETAPIVSLMASRDDAIIRNAIWIAARNRTTGATETLGVWDGTRSLTLTVAGVARSYMPAQGLFTLPSFVVETGLDERIYRIPIAPMSEEFNTAVRTFDARNAPIDIRRLVYHPVTGALVGHYRLWRGFIDELSLPRGAIGASAEGEIACVSSVRSLHRTLGFKKSDVTQTRRSGDRFRCYISISGAVRVIWK